MKSFYFHEILLTTNTLYEQRLDTLPSATVTSFKWEVVAVNWRVVKDKVEKRVSFGRKKIKPCQVLDGAPPVSNNLSSSKMNVRLAPIKSSCFGWKFQLET